MVFFNYSTMQMVVKVVYYGPGLCGKTTNLEFIYSKTAANSRGEMVSLETETDRTLFFDLLPIDVGVIGGFKTKFQLYTVPGQVFYNSTRKLVLKGVDGLIFVADSQKPMLDANHESFENLKVNLKELDMTINDIPIVFQYNKRDLNNILSVHELNKTLNPMNFPFVESSAITGQGVFETLKLVSKYTLFSVKKTMSGKKEETTASKKLAKKELEDNIKKKKEENELLETMDELKKPENQEDEISKDFFEDEDLVLDDTGSEIVSESTSEVKVEEDFEIIPAIPKEELEEKPVIKMPKIEPKIEEPKIEIPLMAASKPKKNKSAGLSVDDLMNDLMPTKQTFTKQVKFDINGKVFKNIASASITVDFKDESGNVVDTKTFDSGIHKKKGIKKVLLKYLIDLEQ